MLMILLHLRKDILLKKNEIFFFQEKIYLNAKNNRPNSPKHIDMKKMKVNRNCYVTVILVVLEIINK